MFSKTRVGWIVLTLVVAVVPIVARAGLGHRGCGSCGRCTRAFSACQCSQPFCGACQMAPANCTCQVPVVQTQIVPQTTTIYRQEQVTTMQPVTRTEIRRQAQVIDVPITTCRQVTVDEGSYQTVWVPKMTTKTVSETTVQKQVRYQDVPYQVVQQVPVTQTRIVPQQVTAFHQRSYVASAPVHLHHHHEHAHVITPGIGVPAVSFEPIPESAAMAIAPTPATRTAQADIASSPEAPSSEWSKVPIRTAQPSTIQQQNFEVEVPLVRPQYVPAGFPSAAAVWQSQGAFSRN